MHLKQKGEVKVAQYSVNRSLSNTIVLCGQKDLSPTWSHECVTGNNNVTGNTCVFAK